MSDISNDSNNNINFVFDANTDTKNSNNNDNKVREYLKDEYITDYVIGRNHRECISNLLKLHNESVNVWTMIISNLSVLLITIYVFMRCQFSKLYTIVFILHLLAYTIHTPFSVCYHTFNTINKDEYIKWRKYDVYTIFLRCIILSFTISFFTYSDLKYVLLNTSLTIVVVYYSLLKFKESEDKHEPLDKLEQGKIIGYVVFTYLIPLIYKVYTSYIKNNFNITSKLAFFNIIIVLLFGSLYCLRIPEKYFEPGIFNKIGTSHNLFHFGIILTTIIEVLYICYCAKEGYQLLLKRI